MKMRKIFQVAVMEGFTQGGAVSQLATGTEYIEADAPFISLIYNHGAVPHELCHLLDYLMIGMTQLELTPA